MPIQQTRSQASNLLYPALIAGLLLTSANTGHADSAETFSPQSIGGFLCAYYAPTQYVNLLDDLSLEYGRDLNDFGNEIRRSIERRFDDRVHLPYPKGCLLVMTPRGVEYWYCEETSDAAAARELVDLFTAQWQAPPEVERPIYRVKVESPSKDTWTAQVFNVTWIPKLVADPNSRQNVKPEWQSTERPGRTYWFRFENGWLWSGDSDSLLRADTLDLLPPVQEVDNSADPNARLFATAWLKPATIPDSARGMAVAAMTALTATQMQPRDGEPEQASQVRRVLKELQVAGYRSLLNDVAELELSIWTSDQDVSMELRADVQKNTATSRFLSEMVPRRNHDRNRQGNFNLEMDLSASIPVAAVAVLQDAMGRRKSTVPVDLAINGWGLCESPESASAVVETSSSQEQFLMDLISGLLPQVMDSQLQPPLFDTPLYVRSSFSPNQATVRTEISGPNAAELIIPDAIPATDQRDQRWHARPRFATLQLQVDATAFETLGQPWLVSLSSSTEESVTENAGSDRPRFSVKLAASADGLELSSSCSLTIARRILAALVLDRNSPRL